jgi:hypothetical protein
VAIYPGRDRRRVRLKVSPTRGSARLRLRQRSFRNTGPGDCAGLRRAMMAPVAKVIIRPAVPGDAGGIARVCAEGWRDTYQDIYRPEEIETVISDYYTSGTDHRGNHRA